MEELKRLILQADDEYLSGLSNKGTVKRAVKDLEEEEPEVVWKDGEAEVAFKGAACRIRVPLGESSCSCPSRSICRHRIAAILYLRRALAGQQESGETPQEDETGQTEGRAENRAEDKAKDKVKGKAENTAEGEELREALKEELLAVPLERLTRACGVRAYRAFVTQLEAGRQPVMEQGSTITVRFPWDDTVVKLLHPLEYSACSCHSRGLCAHKAQAILAFQLETGAVTWEKLRAGTEKESEWDFEALCGAARTIKEEIGLQLKTGLSRLSPDAGETMERLAVISHGAGLADFETAFRSAASEYDQYFGRRAAFREERLMRRLLSLYRLACRLEQAKEADEVSALAGVFREEYLPAPRLHLTAVGLRHFHSKSGYEGDRYYFLETEQKRWYTWTDARPTYYEAVRRRPAQSAQNSQAPWGLNCSREKMMELEFYLIQARATQEGRLSVSRDTGSEIVGKRDLEREEIRHMIVRDYRRLLNEELLAQEEPLALVEAVSCGEAGFDSVRQRLCMELRDRGGRRLQVSVTYSKEERLTIQALERLGRQRQEKGEGNQKGGPLLFFGIPFVEEGQLCLYPIEIFRLPETEKEEAGSLAADGTGRAGGCAKESGKESEPFVSREAVKALEELLQRIRRALADLFQSGLYSVQEGTSRELLQLEKESEEMGLHRAGEELARLNGQLDAGRHQVRTDMEPVILSWDRLMQYVEIGLRRTALDQAMASMNESCNGSVPALVQ